MAPPATAALDADATDFLFYLVTTAHETAFEAARGEDGASYRAQIASEAVEAIEQLGADVRGCDAEAQDGAPLTLLTLLFACGNDWGGRRADVIAAAVKKGADPNAYGTIAVPVQQPPAQQQAQQQTPPARSVPSRCGAGRGRVFPYQPQAPPAPPPPACVRVLVTPLHLAALKLDAASARALLEAGADPNAHARVWRGAARGGGAGKGGGGPPIGTPLHFLASASPDGPTEPQGRGQPAELDKVAAALEALLRHGARLDATTASGARPRDVAAGGAAALPWGRRRCGAAAFALKLAARRGAEGLAALREHLARRLGSHGGRRAVPRS